jgi:flavorubredoxin
MGSTTEIAEGVYRMEVWVEALGMGFDHFLIDDDEPLLFHAGMRGFFPELRDAVARVLDPARLRWIAFSHFESDECGALGQWLEVAAEARPLCGVVGAMVNIADFAQREPRPMADGERLSLGRHVVRWVATPHVPHGWDAGLLFEETDRTLFCSDLFFQGGAGEPLVTTDIVGPALAAVRMGMDGPLAGDMPWTPQTRGTLERLATLEPRTLAPMHGPSYRGDGATALRDLAAGLEPLLGRPA